MVGEDTLHDPTGVVVQEGQESHLVVVALVHLQPLRAEGFVQLPEASQGYVIRAGLKKSVCETLCSWLPRWNFMSASPV